MCECDDGLPAVQVRATMRLATLRARVCVAALGDRRSGRCRPALARPTTTTTTTFEHRSSSSGCSASRDQATDRVSRALAAGGAAEPRICRRRKRVRRRTNPAWPRRSGRSSATRSAKLREERQRRSFRRRRSRAYDPPSSMRPARKAGAGDAGRPRPAERRPTAALLQPDELGYQGRLVRQPVQGPRQGGSRDVHRRAAAHQPDRAADRLPHAVAEPSLRPRRARRKRRSRTTARTTGDTAMSDRSRLRGPSNCVMALSSCSVSRAGLSIAAFEIHMHEHATERSCVAR